MFYRIVVLNHTFWRYLNSQVSINKMVNSLDSYSSPSRLALKKHPFIFLWTPKGFISLSRMLVQFSLKLLHSTMWEKVSNLWSTLSYKMNWFKAFLLIPFAIQNLSPSFRHQFLGRKKLLIPPGSILSKISFPQ